FPRTECASGRPKSGRIIIDLPLPCLSVKHTSPVARQINPALAIEGPVSTVNDQCDVVVSVTEKRAFRYIVGVDPMIIWDRDLPRVRHRIVDCDGVISGRVVAKSSESNAFTVRQAPESVVSCVTTARIIGFADELGAIRCCD